MSLGLYSVVSSLATQGRPWPDAAVRRLHTARQVSDALQQCNGPRTYGLYTLPLNSEVLVWREHGKKWTGPYRLISINGEDCVIEMPHGPTTFCTTVVKPFRRETDRHEPDDTPTQPAEMDDQDQETPVLDRDNQNDPDQHSSSQDNPADHNPVPERRNPPRQRQVPARFRQFITVGATPITTTFLSNKEHLDFSSHSNCVKQARSTMDTHLSTLQERRKLMV